MTASGRLIEERVERAEDDVAARRRFVRGEDGRVVEVQRYPEGPQTLRWDQGRLVGIDDELGGVFFEYDGQGRPSVRSASFGEATATTRYTYDPQGRVTTLTRTLTEDAAQPSLSNTARLSYDETGRLSACTLEGADGALRVTYDYDERGRLRRRRAADAASGQPAWSWAYHYDCPSDDGG